MECRVISEAGFIHILTSIPPFGVRTDPTPQSLCHGMRRIIHAAIILVWNGEAGVSPLAYITYVAPSVLNL
jgi:hypothetical protein